MHKKNRATNSINKWLESIHDADAELSAQRSKTWRGYLERPLSSPSRGPTKNRRNPKQNENTKLTAH